MKECFTSVSCDGPQCDETVVTLDYNMWVPEGWYAVDDADMNERHFCSGMCLAMWAADVAADAHR